MITKETIDAFMERYDYTEYELYGLTRLIEYLTQKVCDQVKQLARAKEGSQAHWQWFIPVDECPPELRIRQMDTTIVKEDVLYAHTKRYSVIITLFSAENPDELAYRYYTTTFVNDSEAIRKAITKLVYYIYMLDRVDERDDNYERVAEIVLPQLKDYGLPAQEAAPTILIPENLYSATRLRKLCFYEVSNYTIDEDGHTTNTMTINADIYAIGIESGEFEISTLPVVVPNAGTGIENESLFAMIPPFAQMILHMYKINKETKLPDTRQEIQDYEAFYY